MSGMYLPKWLRAILWLLSLPGKLRRRKGKE